MIKPVTAKRLNEVFKYSDGNLYYKIDLYNKTKKKGDMAGNLNVDGYLQVMVDYKQLLVHRVIWAVVYGKYPKGEIDHINGCRTDNRIENLRDASKGLNRINSIKHRNGHLFGTCYRKRLKKWEARVPVHLNKYNKTLYIGAYKTMQLAHNAVLSYIKEEKKNEKENEKKGN